MIWLLVGATAFVWLIALVGMCCAVMAGKPMPAPSLGSDGLGVAAELRD